MTAVLLIATMLDRKISSLVWSYHFELLPSHRVSIIGNFSSAISVGKHADVYDFFFYDLLTYPISVFWSCVYRFPELRLGLP